MKCFSWIVKIYSLFLGINPTGPTISGREMCNYPFRKWCRSKCLQQPKWNSSSLCSFSEENNTSRKTAFTQCKYRSQNYGIHQTWLFPKYLKYVCFKCDILQQMWIFKQGFLDQNSNSCWNFCPSSSSFLSHEFI